MVNKLVIQATKIISTLLLLAGCAGLLLSFVRPVMSEHEFFYRSVASDIKKHLYDAGVESTVRERTEVAKPIINRQVQSLIDYADQQKIPFKNIAVFSLVINLAFVLKLVVCKQSRKLGDIGV